MAQGNAKQAKEVEQLRDEMQSMVAVMHDRLQDYEQRLQDVETWVCDLMCRPLAVQSSCIPTVDAVFKCILVRGSALNGLMSYQAISSHSIPDRRKF